MQFLGRKPLIAEHIRTCSKRPSDAFSEAHRFQSEVRNDWQHVKIEKVCFNQASCRLKLTRKSKMDEVLHLKFEQHASLRRELLGTGDAELIEVSLATIV